MFYYNMNKNYIFQFLNISKDLLIPQHKEK